MTDIRKPLILNPTLNVTFVTDLAGLEKVRSFLETLPDTLLGLDLETTPVKDFYYRKIRTIQVGNQTSQFVIDLLAFVDNDSDVLFMCQGDYGKRTDSRLKPILELLKPWLCSDRLLKCGVNLGFEFMCLYWSFGLRPWNFFDCSLVERVIQAGYHSLKDYDYYDLENMMGRYFNVQIDKTLQTSFNLSDPLTQAQIEYAALDTRLPFALKAAQSRIIKKDKLEEVSLIENNAIGAFIDMHVHGWRIDREKWDNRSENKKQELSQIIKDLDTYFIPIVGTKNVVITDEDIAEAVSKWKTYNVVSDEELQVKRSLKFDKLNPELLQKLSDLENARKEIKEKYKLEARDLGKHRTKVRKLIEKCEGQALINYGSEAQVFDVFKQMKGLAKLSGTDDDTLAKYDKIPVIKTFRKYRELAKQVSTYGNTWTKEWITHPCNEEGWLHPGDGRLHSKFNQLEAETGRSSSSQPNNQNLPQDPEIRSCFIADAPDELEPEGYCIVTADMSGAELRIIAELANAKTWIEAFARGEDVHSVGTELMYPEKWPQATLRSKIHPEQWTLKDCKEEVVLEINKDGKVKKLGPCLFYATKDNGMFAKEKCDCPEHKKMRDGNKSTNFLLAYGGIASTLAERLFIPLKEAEEIMSIHKSTFPDIWEYLELSGKKAAINKEARSMWNRRRGFPEPTWDNAKKKVIDDAKSEEGSRWEKCMRRDFSAIFGKLDWEDVLEKVKEDFKAKNDRKPKKDELYDLTHIDTPASKHISSMMKSMHQRIERQGKNHDIQSTNADIAKLAMGFGYCKNGIPFLSHTLPQYGAKLLAFVHDELIIQAPKRFASKVAELVGDAFKRAAAEKMTKVVMEFDFHIAPHWQK